MLPTKRALITGIGGQMGSYLAELLLDKGYEVHGIVRRSATPNTSNIDHIKPRLVLHMGDLADSGSLERAVVSSQPDEIYNLAAMSHVRHSYDIPAYTVDITGSGYCRLLEIIRHRAAQAKVYQACSSEMFGKVQEVPQTETTPFYPRSPYGCAKALTYYLGRSYRESYGLQIYNGIVFNHDSPRRGTEFLTRKVAIAVARIKLGKQTGLALGNLEARRDIGYAKEYAFWIWRMLQHPTPDDFLLATGVTRSIEYFVRLSFEHVGLNWQDHVTIDPGLKRPAEVDLLHGDASKARRLLGFDPKVGFEELVKIMVDAELEAQNVRA